MLGVLSYIVTKGKKVKKLTPFEGNREKRREKNEE